MTPLHDWSTQRGSITTSSLLTSNDYISINNRLPSPPKQSNFVMQHPSSDTSLPTGSGYYKRLKTLPISTSPASINDLSAELCCNIADFLPKTSRALLAAALTAPPASFRESGWKGQPNALSAAIILSTKADLPYSSLLDELGEEDCAEAETEGKYRALKRFGHYFREHSSEQMKEYYCENNGNGNNWSVLDFVDLPMSLAMRLSSNHCLGCKGEVFDTLLDECNSKQVQIDSQDDELERLRSIIEEQKWTIQANQKFSTK